MSVQEANGIPPHGERTKDVTKEAQNKKDAPQQMPSRRERIRKSSPKLHRDKQTRLSPRSIKREREKGISYTYFSVLLSLRRALFEW